MSNAFIACGFPVRGVDRVVQNYEPKTEEEKQKQKENLDSLDKIYLPYIPRVSNKLKKQLKNLKVLESNIQEDGLLEAYCAKTNRKTQMEEERMLYIAFPVNVAWYTLEKLGNGLMQEHSNIKQP